MRVQEIKTNSGDRYILLDDNFEPVEAVNKYLKFLDNIGKATNTLKNYAYHLKTYFEYLKLKNLKYDEINNNDREGALDILAGYIAWLQVPESIYSNVSHIGIVESKRSNSTINIMTNTVLRFYDYLAKNQYIDDLDVYEKQRKNSQFKGFLYELSDKKTMIKKSLLKKKEPKKNVEYITRVDYNAILKLCYTTRDKLIVAFMFEGGLRLGEVLGMHLEDIDIWENKINIVSRINLENKVSVKNNSEGYVFLPNYVIDLLSDYILNELDEYDTNFLFVNLKGKNKGKPMKPITTQKLFKRFSKQLGKSINPHMCRHGYATERLEAGFQLIDIKEELRHGHISSTEIYTHLTLEERREKVKKFYNGKGIFLGDDNIEE